MPSRLKSLELQGYKTFASRTVFEFADTVTAIVGPNGSGKSNIGDSLRWVLGEQSYSLLRGRKTEDMIFSGSEGRSRAGMASATVLFDNEDGWLPIDFNEVSISRRAYRDGQNEYFINNQRVRLRDITELLSQSGLAERTYTVIGQGVVDAALALKAEERRRLFEEAAGIGLHRSRREEALRRLETTRRNLDRVQDILAELRPRLRSLERQARRAQEFEQVRNDLKELLREFYGYHWHHAQRELLRAREYAGVQEKELEAVRKSQSSLDLRLTKIRERIAEIRATLNTWHHQLSELHRRRESLGRKRAVAEERSRSLSEQKFNLENEIARLTEERQLHKERLELIETEVESQQTQWEEAKSQSVSARKALDERRSEREQADARTRESQRSLERLLTQKREIETHIAERANRIDRIQAELEERLGGLKAATGQLDRLRIEDKGTREAVAEAEAQRVEAEQKLEALRLEIEAAEERVRKLEQQRSSHEAGLARLRARIEVLDQAEASLTGYANGAQVLLKAIQDRQLDGGLGALSARLTVDPAYEVAIAAALGEYLDAILLSREVNVDAALDMLGAETSRGVVLPLDGLQETRSGLDIRGSGVLGKASEFVEAPEEIAKALNLLLENTWLVQDRAAARGALAWLRSEVRNGFGARIVTLRGEVFVSGGAVISGGENRPASLSRPRERKEINAELARFEEKISELGASLEKSIQERAVLRDRESTLVSLVREGRKLEEEARNRFRQVSLNLSEAERTAKWLADQRTRAETDIRDASNEIEQFEGKLSNLAVNIESATVANRERTEELSRLDTEEQRAQVAHWNTALAVAERALTDARARLEERRSLYKRAENSLATAQNRQVEIARLSEELVVEQSSGKMDSTELGDEIEALTEKIKPAEAELTQAEAEADSLLKEESKARNALSSAEHRNSQARINLARHQESLETWRRRIEDDFGLVAFEYDSEVSGPTPLPIQGMVEQLPRITNIAPELEESVRRQRNQLRRMGAINPEAQSEYNEVRNRYEFMTAQVADLEKAEVDVHQVIAELDDLMHREFRQTFDAVAEEFSEIFKRLFGGGNARLVLTDPEDMTNTGIDIEARLPGRREQGLSLLSGGERSLAATSLIFSLLRVSPTPFCIMDEVDAMLDEANVGRFRDLLRELSKQTQFIIVTHNRNTVQVADVIYGVTMGRDSASQVISLKLDDVPDVVE